MRAESKQFFFVLNMHESHERHESKTRQNSEAIAEVGDATQQGFLPTPLPMLSSLSSYPEEGGQ